MSEQDKGLALVIGATGGIGGEVATLLAARGWTVRAMHRRPEEAARTGPQGLEWVAGDAMSAADVAAAARGASLIVHAVNPPGYRNWAGTVLPMLDNTIAAAKAQGARIIFPGSVYNFGTDAFPSLTEASPQHPFTRKGALRKEMEQRLEAASKEGARALIVRAGDFFGPVATNNNWIGHMVAQGKPVTAVTYPGPRAIPHAWAYLPDMAQAIVDLAEREAGLEAFAVFHFRGHQMTGDEMVAAYSRIAGRKLPVRAFPWLAVSAISPFVEMLRELLEMRYLWKTPVLLDNAKLVETLGAEPHTLLDTALRATLKGLGCLNEPLLQAA
jgi:nucleoside-diphosphate-sugar epimerase